MSEAYIPPVDQSQPKPKRKRHIFRWVFLAIQVLFLIWIISAIADSGAENCGSLSTESCQAASNIGTGIGVALLIGLWVAVDIILALTYLIFGRKN